jgi:demethylmenaquinone methyltransferase/2-methoxy-6-polyprenyl-1,4-benzoquinol methylase
MEKKDQIQRMFNDISSRYDLLNHLLSFGIDYTWRRKFVRQLSRYTPKQVLDVATGTGDLAILVGSLATVQQVIGIDNASNMIIIAKDKVLQNKFNNKIVFRDGDAEAIPFPDGSFDAVTVAFGVRNYENLEKGLTEMRRVLRSGGVLMILEFSHPEAIPWKQLYGFYAKYIIPLIGRLVSKHKQAYTYLPESVSAFPSGKDFTKILSKLGVKNVTRRTLTFGIATIYSGEK